MHFFLNSCREKSTTNFFFLLLHSLLFFFDCSEYSCYVIYKNLTSFDLAMTVLNQLRKKIKLGKIINFLRHHGFHVFTLQNHVFYLMCESRTVTIWSWDICRNFLVTTVSTTFLTEDTVGDLHTQKEEHSSLLLVSSCANSSDKKIPAYISTSDSNSTTFTHQVKNMILECKNMKPVVSQKIDNFSQFYFFLSWLRTVIAKSK